MSFIQKVGYNIRSGKKFKIAKPVSADMVKPVFCDGCDKQCELGYSFCKFGCHIFPAIAGRAIDWYLDKNGDMVYAAVNIPNEWKQDERMQDMQKANMIAFAYRVAKLCDNYKRQR